MTDAATLVSTARRAAGLTQAQLASRLELTQPAIAQLEAPGANPTLATLERTLRAAGHDLEIKASPRQIPEVDETLIASRLRLTPAERLASFEASQHNLNELVRSARRVDSAA
jgi:transcriptional regulator with XRE-family HTH domain